MLVGQPKRLLGQRRGRYRWWLCEATWHRNAHPGRSPLGAHACILAWCVIAAVQQRGVYSCAIHTWKKGNPGPFHAVWACCSGTKPMTQLNVYAHTLAHASPLLHPLCPDKHCQAACPPLRPPPPHPPTHTCYAALQSSMTNGSTAGAALPCARAAAAATCRRRAQRPADRRQSQQQLPACHHP